MKAITIWQPWATLIALGHKKVETRHWPTSYRGPIAIHAAKRKMTADEHDLLDDIGLYHPELNLVVRPDHYPLGCIVAVASLTKCLRMTDRPHDQPTDLERELGNWAPGRYAWVLENVQRVQPPIPTRGEQGLWNWQPPTALEAETNP